MDVYDRGAKLRGRRRALSRWNGWSLVQSCVSCSRSTERETGRAGTRRAAAEVGRDVAGSAESDATWIPAHCRSSGALKGHGDRRLGGREWADTDEHFRVHFLADQTTRVPLTLPPLSEDQI